MYFTITFHKTSLQKNRTSFDNIIRLATSGHIMKKNYLKRHSFYVDTRIDNIVLFLKNLSEKDHKNITHEIMKSIISGFPFSDSYLRATIYELHQILKRWPVETDGDLAGYIYAEIQNKKEKNRKGQYFTPAEIVSSITEKIITKANYFNLKILDPACGSGHFLISAFKRLFSFYLEDGHSPAEAALHIIKNSIFGSDTDETAIEIAKFNITTIAGLSSSDTDNIYVDDFLSDADIFSRGKLRESFDCIIGNPPWGSDITADKKLFYKQSYSCAKSGVNSFTLFLEKSLSLLKHNGRLGFLLPEAYLNIKAHSQSRKDILSSCRIEEISTWGEQFKNVFAPSTSIILQKDSSDARKTHVVKIQGKEQRIKKTQTLIPQSHFSKTHESIFNIKFEQKAESLINTINSCDSIYLQNNASFFLGIVTGNNNHHLFDSFSDEHPDPIITGKDMIPFKIKTPTKYFCFKPENLQQTASIEYYKKPDKFLYKFIGSRLTFAYDNEGRFSLNNVNGFIPRSLLIDDQALLAVLNSSLIQYYYHNSFFTIKVLRGNLERIPIKIMKKDSQKKICSLVKKLHISDSYHETEAILGNIDDIVFHEYGINDKDAASVYTEFNPSQISGTLSSMEQAIQTIN